MHQEVRSILLAWVAPSRLLAYDHLIAPTTQGGLIQPLRCTTQANTAFLLSKRTLLHRHTSLALRRPTAKISSHILNAATNYRKVVGTPPPEDGTFKEVLALLGRHDKTALNALVKQLAPSKVGRESEYAAETAARIHRNLDPSPSPTSVPRLLALPQCCPDPGAHAKLLAGWAGRVALA